MKLDALHCALVALIVLLAIYVARGSGFFIENLVQTSLKRDDKAIIEALHMPIPYGEEAQY